MFKIIRGKIVFTLTVGMIASGLTAGAGYVGTRGWNWHNEKDAADVETKQWQVIRDQHIIGVKDELTAFKTGVKSDLSEIKAGVNQTNSRLDQLMMQLIVPHRLADHPTRGD
jgi:hypothetical protein